jgi:hypothetical protein
MRADVSGWMSMLMKLENTEILKEDFEKTVSLLAERLDFWDVQVLRKFYVTGKDFPFDTQPYCFPILYRELCDSHRLKVGAEALRKRLSGLVKCEFLEKIKKTNPTTYEPVRGKEEIVRAVIMKFFLIHGLFSSFK